MMISVFIMVLAVSAFAQQGPGRGQGAKAGRTGQPCPYGYQQGTAPQGGWWNTVQPKTSEQKAFVAEVKKLHEQIRVKQLDLNKMKANKAPASQVATAQKDLDSLRTRLHNTMYNHRTLMQQMGVSNANCPNMQNCANCKYNADGKCTCPNVGQCCPQAKNCPMGQRQGKGKGMGMGNGQGQGRGMGCPRAQAK